MLNAYYAVLLQFKHTIKWKGLESLWFHSSSKNWVILTLVQCSAQVNEEGNYNGDCENEQYIECETDLELCFQDPLLIALVAELPRCSD